MSQKLPAPRAATLRRSTIGRPRTLTDEQVVAILAWHDAMTAWKATRGSIKTLRQLAKDMGGTHGAITSVIRLGGELKQASPAQDGKQPRPRGGST